MPPGHPELRDEIIQLVAFTPCAPPLSPQKFRHGSLEWDQLAVSGTMDNSFFFLDASSVVTQRAPKQGDGPNNTALGLLLTNRQLHDETEHLLRTRGLTYQMDITDGNFPSPSLWVSWLCVPRKARHVETLHAQIRLFDTRAPSAFDTQREDLRFQSSFMSTSYQLFLSSFLQNGPFANTVSRLRHEARFSAKTLVFDIQQPLDRFVSGPESLPGMVFVKPSLIERSADNLYEWTVKFLQGRRDHQDSRILYQGFGSIEIRVAGKLHHVVNLTDLYCRLPDADLLWPLLLFAHRWEFQAWVDSTIEKRKKLGLWDDTVMGRLRDAGEPECGLLIPGLWWTLLEDDWRPPMQSVQVDN